MKKRIWVMGSANIDVVLPLARVPLAGETVTLSGRKCIPGGKGANRAVALQRLGAQPVFSCCIGSDEYGKMLAETYQNENMDMSQVSAVSSGTGTAYIFVENSGNNCIAVLPAANSAFGSEKISEAEKNIASISLISTECEIPLDSVEKIIGVAAKHGVPAVVDTAPVNSGTQLNGFKGAFLISPNESEARALTGIEIVDDESARCACAALFAAGVKYALVKLGSRGSLCYDGKDFVFCPVFSGAGSAVDTTAAGDCYMAALCRSLSLGQPIEKAMRFATVAAGISVTRHGAIPSLPYLNEVEKNM